MAAVVCKRQTRQILTLLLTAWLCGPALASAQSAPGSGIQEGLQARLAVADGALVDMEGIALLSPKLVRAFYAMDDGEPVWGVGRRFRSLSRELLRVLRSAKGHGLSPPVYHQTLIAEMTRLSHEHYTAVRQVDIELLFTDALLSFAKDLLEGRARHLDLKQASIDAAQEADVKEVARAALAAGDLQSVVEQLAPKPLAYQGLRDALSELRRLMAEEWPFDLPERTLRAGDIGGEIAALRRRLEFLGDLPRASDDDSGIFGPVLSDAVKRFQSRHGLEVDGIVGKETRQALETPIRQRVEQLELTLERWRWLPQNPGDRYVLVNIGGQDLEVFENGRATLRMRVIVGRPFQRTPSFASQIETVVLNPYWEVPHSIAVNEILPSLRRDPAYLSRENMRVLPRLDGGSQPIDPSTIDWDQVSGADFPYRFRQQPGPDNSLGVVKFLMPNPYSVYLHDTPAKTLFSRARRCFSHGCVRLEKPIELANLLLHDEPGWCFERLRKTLETEQDFRIRLTRAMPVYLVYWTAWVDNDGTIQLRPDVYGRDERLSSALDELEP